MPSMVPYDPNIHGDITSNTAPSAGRGMVPYDPNVHGEIQNQLDQSQKIPIGRTVTSQSAVPAQDMGLPFLGRSTAPTVAQASTSGAMPPAMSQVVQGSAAGVLNAPRNIAETFVDIAKGANPDKVAARKPGEKGLGDKMLDYIPEFKVENQTELGRGAQEVAGAVTGALIPFVGPAAKASKLGQVANYVYKGIASNFTSAAAMDEDSSKLLFGPDGVLTQWGFDEKGTVDQQRLEKRMNLLADAYTLAGGIEAVALPIKRGLNDLILSPTAKGLWEFFSPDAQNKFVGKNVMKIIAGIDEAVDSPEVIQDKLQKAAALLKTNKPETIEFSKAFPGVSDQTVKTDTGTFMTEALAKENPEANSSLIADINNARKAAKGPVTEGAIQQPMRGLEKAGEEINQLFGGVGEDGFVKYAGDTALEKGELARVRPLQNQLGDVMAQKENLRNYLVERLNKDPLLQGEAIKLVGDVGLDVTKNSQELMPKLAEMLIQKGQEMTTRKNEYFNSIAELGVRASPEIINKAAQNLSEATSKKLKPILTAIKNSDMSLSSIMSIANGDLTIAIEKAYNQSDTLGRELSNFKRALTDDQFEFVVRSKQAGSAEAKKRIDEAYKYFKEEYLPLRENEALREIMDVSGKSGGGGVKGLAPASSALESAIGNISDAGRRLTMDGVVEFVDKNVGTRGTQGLGKWAVTKYAESIQEMINRTGALSPEDAMKTISAGEKIAPLLGKADPRKLKELENLMTDLRNGLVSSERLEPYIVELTSKVAQSEKTLYDEIFKEFSITNKSIPNSFDGFKKLFTKSGNENKVREIMGFVGDDFVAQDGIRAALNDTLMNDYFFTSSGSRMSSGARSPNLAGINEYLQPNSSIRAYVRETMGPEAAELYGQAVKKIFDATKTTAGKQDLGMHLGEIDKNGANAINRVITWVWGVLNPTAARVRTVTSQYLNANPTNPYLREYLDKVMANSDLLLEIADEMIRAGGEPILTQTQKDAIAKGLKRGAVSYMDEDNLNQQTQEVFGNEVQEQR